MTSELVTNAVTATGVAAAEPRWSQLAGLATIHLRLLRFDRSVVIAVWDRDPAPPVPRDPGTDSEDGRGLAIVAALCQRWDYLPVPGGKCVWAELAIPPGALTPAGLPPALRWRAKNRAELSTPNLGTSTLQYRAEYQHLSVRRVALPRPFRPGLRGFPAAPPPSRPGSVGPRPRQAGCVGPRPRIAPGAGGGTRGM